MDINYNYNKEYEYTIKHRCRSKHGLGIDKKSLRTFSTRLVPCKLYDRTIKLRHIGKEFYDKGLKY